MKLDMENVRNGVPFNDALPTKLNYVEGRLPPCSRSLEAIPKIAIKGEAAMELTTRQFNQS